MKKLEEKIINKIYKIELKKTIEQIVFKGIIFLITIFFSLFIFSIIIEILNEQSSFDLFDFLKDGIETVGDSMLNNLLLFIQELTMPLIFILLVLSLFVVWIIIVTLKNRNIIKNKFHSLYKFWFT